MQSLDKYLSESKEWMLKFVAGEKCLSEEAFKREEGKSVAVKTDP